MAEPILSPGETPVLHVCQTCRDGGEALHDALAALAGETAVRVQGVRCLAACQQGCTATLSMPGKWSWLLGRLHPGLAPDLLLYAQAYARSPSGTVMPSRRPESLREVILGRFPSMVDAAPGKASPADSTISPQDPAPRNIALSDPLSPQASGNLA
ncbi:hypothetical protein C0V97_09725 [Asaia sp. W19]|nr:hypothetical protein C0V97_17075 [Asaia sp. W19]RUT25784.1 hypothetical protein C0V97_09725 [Asaia sp. W19]